MFYNFQKNKKILIFLLFVFLFLGLSSFIFATEVPLPGWDPEAVERRELLPEYVRYIFNFSLIIAGLIAFGVLIYAGFRYLISAGNPTEMSDAKDRIFSALLGLVILLASYLILVTIDPHLVVLRAPERPVGAGIFLYDAEGNSRFFSTSAHRIEGFNAVRYKIEGFKLEDIRDMPNRPRRIKITVYPEINHGGEGRLLEEIEGTLLIPPRSLALVVPELPFAYEFLPIDRPSATVRSECAWHEEAWCVDAAARWLELKLIAGSPQRVAFILPELTGKLAPLKGKFEFKLDGRGLFCSPPCERKIIFESNGAPAGTYEFIIRSEPIEVPEGVPIYERTKIQYQTFELTIK